MWEWGALDFNRGYSRQAFSLIYFLWIKTFRFGVDTHGQWIEIEYKIQRPIGSGVGGDGHSVARLLQIDNEIKFTTVEIPLNQLQSHLL